MQAMQIEVWITDDDAARLEVMRRRLEEMTGRPYTAAKVLELAVNGAAIDAALREQEELLSLS